MNREERRKRMWQYAKADKERCPLCGKKSVFVSIPTAEHFVCDVRCELCNGIVIKGRKDLIPMTYVKLRMIMQETEKGGE